jgi:hypothetical protein
VPIFVGRKPPSMAQRLVAIVGAYKQPRKEELRMTKGKKLAGMAIAASAALLFIGGCANTGTGGASEAQIMCEGANGCKGLSDCKTANSACAGQNECKGLGIVSLSSSACGKITGRTG